MNTLYIDRRRSGRFAELMGKIAPQSCCVWTYGSLSSCAYYFDTLIARHLRKWAVELCIKLGSGFTGLLKLPYSERFLAGKHICQEGGRADPRESIN